MSDIGNILTSAGSNIAGSVLGSKINTGYQKDLMNYANNINMANWRTQFDAQNARQDQLNNNAAVTQRAALSKAGINPAVMNSSQFSNNVASPSPTSQSGSAISSLGMENLGSLFMQQQQLEMQKDVASAQVEMYRANAKKAEADANYTSLQAEKYPESQDLVNAVNKALSEKTNVDVKIGNQTYEFNKEMNPELINQVIQNSKHLEALAALEGENADKVYKENLSFWENYNRNMDLMISQTKKNLASAGYDAAMTKECLTLLSDKMENLRANTELLRSGKDLNYANVYQSRASKHLMEAQTLVQKSVATMNELQNELTRRFGGYERAAGIINTTLNSASNFMFGASSLKNAFGKKPMKTFEGYYDQEYNFVGGHSVEYGYK